MIEHELPNILNPGNNSFLLSFHKEASLKEPKWCTLYKEKDSVELPDDVLESTLGKKRPPATGDLRKAIRHELVRDYAVTQ